MKKALYYSLWIVLSIFTVSSFFYVADSGFSTEENSDETPATLTEDQLDETNNFTDDQWDGPASSGDVVITHPLPDWRAALDPQEPAPRDTSDIKRTYMTPEQHYRETTLGMRGSDVAFGKGVQIGGDESVTIEIKDRFPDWRDALPVFLQKDKYQFVYKGDVNMKEVMTEMMKEDELPDPSDEATMRQFYRFPKAPNEYYSKDMLLDRLLTRSSDMYNTWYGDAAASMQSEPQYKPKPVSKNSRDNYTSNEWSDLE